jgi:hypothetical protein
LWLKETARSASARAGFAPAFSFLARHLAEHPDIAAEGQQATFQRAGAIGPAEDSGPKPMEDFTRTVSARQGSGQARG